MFQNSFLTTLLNMKSSSVTFQVKQQLVSLHVTTEQKQKEQKYKTSLHHFTITSCDFVFLYLFRGFTYSIIEKGMSTIKANKLKNTLLIDLMCQLFIFTCIKYLRTCELNLKSQKKKLQICRVIFIEIQIQLQTCNPIFSHIFVLIWVHQLSDYNSNQSLQLHKCVLTSSKTNLHTLIFATLLVIGWESKRRTQLNVWFASMSCFSCLLSRLHSRITSCHGCAQIKQLWVSLFGFSLQLMRKTLCLSKYTLYRESYIISYYDFPILARMKKLNMLPYGANASLGLQVCCQY